MAIIMKFSRMMMFINLLIFPLAAPAINPVEIKNLYDARSMIPGVLISAAQSSSASIMAAISDAKGVDCRLMRDPFLSRIFLLKCKAATTVELQFYVVDGSQSYNIHFGPVEVKMPSDDLIIIEPPDPRQSPDYIAGKQLYGAYCAGCHSNPQIRKGRSVSLIQSAIAGQLPGTQPMKDNLDLQGLSEDQIRKISVYLADP
jgi:hypothetical protein